MEIIFYRENSEQVEHLQDIGELRKLLADPEIVVWIDLSGDTDDRKENAKKVLKDVFGFHPLTIEDCIEIRNQPKVEAFDEYLFFIVHGIKHGETGPTNFVTKELDGFLGRNFVVTYHTEEFDSINLVKQKILATTFICQRGAAYLLHNILDELVDRYPPVIDDFDKAIDNIEVRVFDPMLADDGILAEIMDLRRSVARLRRISSRQQEVIFRISRGEFPQIPTHLLPFYRDVHDHLVRVTDISESYRDLVASLFDIHFSVVANRTNDIMKTLAVVSAVILPLSLIAGIYGMNFENMPELGVKYGYFATLGFMALVTVMLLWYFKRRGWIFQRSAKPEADK